MNNNNNSLFQLKNTNIGNLTHSYIMWSVFLTYQKTNENYLLILPNLTLAQHYYDNLSLMCGRDNVLFYPSDGVLTTLMAVGSNEFGSERQQTLFQLAENKQKYIIISTVDAALKLQLTKEDYLNSYKEIIKGNTYKISSLTKLLSYSGYENNYLVEKPGEFSNRGNIIDYYPKDETQPIRIEFFDDEIEQIRIFDVESQRTIKTIDSVSIKPLTELFYHDELLDKAISKINKFMLSNELSEEEAIKIKKDYEEILERKNLDRKALYMNFFTNEPTTIFDFTNENVILIEPELINYNLINMREDIEIYNEKISGKSFHKLSFLGSESLLENHLAKALYVSTPSSDHNNNNNTIYNAGVESLNIVRAELNLIKTILSPYKDYQINLIGPSSDLDELLEDSNNYEILNSFNIIKSHIPESFVNHHTKQIYLKTNLFTTKTEQVPVRYRSVINQAVKIRTVDELKSGDYVVHYDYGIARYLGIKTLAMQGRKRDYLELRYANEEKLYVPIEQMDLILKYKSHDDQTVRLSKLGSNKWSKTKATIKQKVKDLSDKLLNIYAERENSNGYQFREFPELELALSDDFGFVETIDQKEAITNVLNDLSSTKVTDRLIAGDVGFGKTEVALRASYRVVLNAKQVAYLAPTTVLARQHYHTFKDRLSKYGVNVELLNRFVSQKKQKEVIEGLRTGVVDIVVGTHRLLSKDVSYSDLGLLVVDEEQRFGVEDKEKMKDIKVNVDSITLTATPIPRTLQMSLYGIKELSLIQTPPLNRYPVQTYVLAYDMNLVKQAINREISRGGQVFYLYNKVSDIDRIAIRIQEAVPNVRITTLHGQMNKNKLEKEIMKFINHEYDVMVATTIIETGIDIPNTNTLIIHDSDHLGLAQLYQIRGRVGRSDKIAYAYLMYAPYKELTSLARSKLEVIEEFTELGSGFKIALRDLKIRGAGDILGQEQSGFIDAIGIDLYLKLLKDTMAGIDLDDNRRDVDVNFAVKHIDPKYIKSDEARLEIHQKMMKLKSINDINDLIEELVDRFGQPDEQLILLMYERAYRNISKVLMIEKIQVKATTINLFFYEEAGNIDFINMIGEGISRSTDFDLKIIGGLPQLTYHIKNNKNHFLYELLPSLNEHF